MTLADINKYDRRVWLFLIAVTVIKIAIAPFLGVAPQESYYWNYSQHLDLSYFDHPPMSAYLIYLFTAIFGDNSFGVHFAAIFISLILSLVLYYFARVMFNSKVAFWTVVVGATTFIFALGGLVITPDGPLLLFWILSMFALYQADKQNSLNWWFLTGIFLGCGMVSKYTAAFAGLGAIAYIVTSKERIKHLLKPGPYLAAVSALVVFLPVIVWNYTHNWASFGFQSGRRASEISQIRLDYFFGFLGSQVGILAIFLFPLFIWALIRILKRLKNDSRMALFFWYAAPTVVFFTLVAFIHYVKMNWIAPAYISALIPAVYLFFESKSTFLKRYTKFAVIFSIGITILAHVLILLPGFTFGKGDTVAGWPELADRVDEVKAEMKGQGELFICGYEYKTASQLRFYLDGQPETVSNNIVGINGLQYDFWCNPDTLIGKNCIFVYDKRKSYNDRLEQFFEKVEEPETMLIEKGGKKVTEFYIFRCYNYRGIR